MSTISATSQIIPVTNAYSSYYQNSTLNYLYVDSAQIHDFSNNWDFDQDGVKDEVRFIGTGGAHLYYFLCIKLSQNTKAYDFNCLALDLPIHPSLIDSNNNQTTYFNSPAQWMVLENNKYNTEIYIHLDQTTFAANAKILKKKGITSPKIILRFQNDHWQWLDYKENPA